MKIFGINIGKGKKIRPKKQKRIEPAKPPLKYSASFFETKNETEKIKERKNDSSEFKEITLPEKSKVDIDDDTQIGFVPEQDIHPQKEKFFDEEIIPHSREDNLSINQNKQKDWLNNFQETDLIQKEKPIVESSDELKSELKEKAALLEEISLLNTRIKELRDKSQDLDNLIQEKQETINQLEDRINILNIEINSSIEEKRSLLSKLNEEIDFKSNEIKKIDEAKRVDENNALLIMQTELQLKDKILELDSIISQKTAEISKLDSELKLLIKNFEQKKSEIQNWEEENKIIQENIQKSKNEIIELERSAIEVHSEVKELLNIKNEIYSEILKTQEELTKLKFEKEKTVELISLSQKRRDEIEFGNDQLEKRLLRMIQKFNDEIKELSVHKTNIEKKITEVESKVTENENIIAEKLYTLKKIEDQLRLRQTELNSINSLITSLNEKEDLISKSITDYEKEISSKRIDNQELKKDIDLLTQKKSAIEKILEDLFISSEQRISRLRETYFKTENEIREKELLYEELNQKIDKSIDELVELQKSIHSQKIECEELEIKSEHLKKLNESLEKEIENNNKILEQFKKMKEDISDGSNEIRKDFSREFGINKDEFNSDPNQKKVFRL